jgi:hypothetical protein
MKRRAAAAGTAVIGGAAAYLLVVRRWQLRWGATDEERDATLAGDDLIPNPDLMATRAITVHTAADQVWPRPCPSWSRSPVATGARRASCQRLQFSHATLNAYPAPHLALIHR